MTLSAATLRRVHLTAMGVWALLLIPTLLWWRNSVPWVIAMSLYANFAAHFSAWQGSRAEAASDDSEGAL